MNATNVMNATNAHAGVHTPATTASAALHATTTTAPARQIGLAALLGVEALLAFAPVAVLAPAIGWPASLRLPAVEQLKAIAAAPDAVALGYGLYLLYSVLIAPVMIALAARAFGGLHRPLAATVAAFAALSALARSIGILRWLTVMPVLASTHAAGDAATRAQAELAFAAINAWGGGIGELLGVSLFMALSVGLLCLGRMPRWLSVTGGAIALALAALPLGMPVAAAVTALSVWMMAMAVWCLRQPV